LVGLKIAAQEPLQRFYCKNLLVTEVQGLARCSIVQQAEQLLAQQLRRGDTLDTALLVTDQQRSVMHTVGEDSVPIVYSPYGHRCAEKGLTSVLGFNGERADAITGHYLLGNGYRAFNPILMRFNSPDSLSPFEAGGLNAYVYCLGDPVGRRDSNGHFSSFNWIKLMMPKVRDSFVGAMAKKPWYEWTTMEIDFAKSVSGQSNPFLNSKIPKEEIFFRSNPPSEKLPVELKARTVGSLKNKALAVVRSNDPGLLSPYKEMVGDYRSQYTPHYRDELMLNFQRSRRAPLSAAAMKSFALTKGAGDLSSHRMISYSAIQNKMFTIKLARINHPSDIRTS
jgi:RHS repeat-associated protein